MTAKVKYGPEPFTYPNGAVAAGVAVTVYAQDTVTKIPLYTDPEGLVPLANPVVTTAEGMLEFYAAPGFYTLSANGELFAIHVVGPLVLAPVALTDAATIAVDASQGSTMRVTLGGDRTLAKPTNPADAQMIMFEITQDGVGGRTLTLADGYHFGTDLLAVLLSSTPDTTDRILVQYVQARDEWDVIGFKKGF